MRGIVLRGKGEKTGAWYYGSLIISTIAGKQKTDSSILENPRTIDLGNGKYLFEAGEVATVIPETVGQYINQVDRNLKKIYEDDILQDNRGKKYCVRWSDGNCGFIAEPIQKSRIWPNLNSGSTKYLEVIGNRHDNPELLRGE